MKIVDLVHLTISEFDECCRHDGTLTWVLNVVAMTAHLPEY